MTDLTPRDDLTVETSAQNRGTPDTRGETEEQAMSRLVEDHAVRAIERHLSAAANLHHHHDVQATESSSQD